MKRIRVGQKEVNSVRAIARIRKKRNAPTLVPLLGEGNPEPGEVDNPGIWPRRYVGRYVGARHPSRRHRTH